MAEISTNSGQSLPYVMAYGNIKKTLDKVIQATTPDRFTQDFLSTRLAIKGGNAKAVIPFMKKLGFLNGDGTPTDIYNQFKTVSQRGIAAARSLQEGYSTLYEMNEYAHDLKDGELKDLVVQATGAAPSSSTVKSIIGSFKAVKDYADFTQNIVEEPITENDETGETVKDNTQTQYHQANRSLDNKIRLGYTINLNLPATADINVYNAIFKSLREHLLDE